MSNPSTNNSSKKGFIVGTFLEIMPIRVMSINLGFRYIQKGIISENQVIKSTLFLNYLEIPITLNFIPFRGNIEPALSGGLYFAPLLSKNQVEDFKTGERYENKPVLNLSELDIGWFTGLTLNFKLSKTLKSFLSGTYVTGYK